MQFAFFFSVLLPITAVLGFYVHRRTASVLGLSPRGRRALAILLSAGLAAVLVARLLRRVLPEGAQRVFMMAGSLLALAMLVSAVLLAAVDLGRLLARLAARFARARALAAVPASASVPTSASVPAAIPVPASAPAPEPPLSRRDFIGRAAAGSALLLGSATSGYGALLGRHDYVLEEIPIPIPGLPRALDGFTLVQLSDIHLGLFAGDAEMRAAEDLVRKARGDLIALTGDLIDFDPRYADALGRLVRRLMPLAREGVVAIPGNHDHMTGIGAVLAALEGAGADVLRNRGRTVGGPGGAFALLGVDDVWASRLTRGAGPDLARAMATVPRDLPRVLLCHNPSFFPKASGEVALQLSGHTHGGQVNVLVRPADLILPHGYVAGLYQRGASRLYVNRGFGTAGPPARVGSPPEVTRIVLVSA